MIEDISVCYRILELEPGASLAEVKRSYRDLVRVWHPDRFPNDPKLQKKGEDKLKQINSAYAQICKSKGKEPPPSPVTTAAASNSETSSKAARTSGSASAHNEPRSSETWQDPPIRPAPYSKGEINWPVRLMKFALTVVGFAIIKSLFSVSATSQKQSQRYQPSYTESDKELQSSESASVLQSPTRHRLNLDEIMLLHGKDQERRKWPESFSVDEIYQLRDGLLKDDPDAHMSVAEFSRYMQKSHMAYDYSAGLAYSPPSETSDPNVQVHITPRDAESNDTKKVESTTAKTRTTPTPAQSSNAKDYFTIGSSKDEVITVQGTPDMFTSSSFQYGSSSVIFENERVKSWNNGYPELKVKLLPSAAVQVKTYFTIGSTSDEVLAVQGTPDSFTPSSLNYGSSSVTFENGRVKSWNSGYPKLKVKLLPSAAVQARSYFTLGSTGDEVLAVQGTPDSFTSSTLNYGSSSVTFENGRVKSWNNGYPQLKVKLLPFTADGGRNRAPSMRPMPEAEGTLYRIAGLSAGDTLNVRGGPGVNHPVVTQLHNGMQVKVVGGHVSNGPDRWLPCLIEGSITDPVTGLSRPWQQNGWINSMFVEDVQAH